MAYSGRHRHHWHFAVRNVPTGDVLHVVNPDSRSTHTEGPANILSLASVNDQAEVVLRLLLEAFVRSICISFKPPTTPWSWGTKVYILTVGADEVLAKALGAHMAASNLPENLVKFFGPYSTDQEELGGYHQQYRIEILLKHAKGSYTPRPATEEEEDDIEMIHDMQSMIKRYMDSRKRKLSSIDMLIWKIFSSSLLVGVERISSDTTILRSIPWIWATLKVIILADIAMMSVLSDIIIRVVTMIIVIERFRPGWSYYDVLECPEGPGTFAIARSS
ncbi:uncharacterized protein PAC_16888 [Phialocephala subalpina]|uniref:Uncharacterized protein n=1 Tax=Phialocephala subalpina TaxID=576137 RepID=A0A1L7XPN3_9HELO|nr:uncharacterized protein PAC_16888 [Phialocephala subalpina]